MNDVKTVNYFNHVKEILSTFDRTERSIVQRFSQVTQKQYKAGHNVKITKALIENPDICASELKKSLDPTMTDQAFYKALTRFKELLFESLILDVNIKDGKGFSDVFIQRVSSRKKILQTYVLFSKGLETDGRKLLEYVIDRGKQYELYDELYEVLHWARNENGLRYGKKKYDKYTEDMECFRICRDAVYEARNIYYDYYIFSDRAGGIPDKVCRIKSALNRLMDLETTTDSKQVKYYYYLLLSEYYALIYEKVKIYDLERDLLKLMKGSLVLKMELKMGVAHSDIADMMLACGQLKKALTYSKKAMGYFDESNYNYFVAEEIKFRAEFFSGLYKESGVTLATSKCTLAEDRFPLILCKHQYYKACLLFKHGKFKESIQVLGGLKLLEKDKRGWNIAIRVLLVLNFLELQEVDVCAAQISSFRKYIERLIKKGDVLPRYICINKVLVSLWKNSLDFKRTYNQESKLLGKLKSEETGYRWSEKSPELVVFHEWFSNKAMMSSAIMKK